MSIMWMRSVISTSYPRDPLVRTRAVNAVNWLVENDLGKGRDEGLASAVTRTIIGVLLTAAPLGQRRPSPQKTVRT